MASWLAVTFSKFFVVNFLGQEHRRAVAVLLHDFVDEATSMLSHKDKLHKKQIHLDTMELTNCSGSGRSMCAAKYVQDSMCIYISYNEYGTIYTLQYLQSYSLNMFCWFVFLNHGALFWQRESTCHYPRTARPTQITAQLRASIAERLERALDFGKLEAQQSERRWYGFIWFHLKGVIIVCAFINVLQCYI